MKSLTLVFCALFLFALTSNAQNKVDSTLAKANTSLASTNTSVNNAGATATNAANTATSTVGTVKSITGTFSGMFKKKPADGPVNITIVTIKGAKFSVVRKLSEAIQNCSADVQDAKIKSSEDGGIITITHTGTTTKLLTAIEKKTDLVNDDNVGDFDEGKFTVTFK